MEPQTRPKTTAEVRIYDFNFEAQPEIVNGGAITAVIELSATPTSPPLTIGTPVIDVVGHRVQVQLSGGTSPTRYKLKCIVQLDSGPLRLEMAGVLSVFDFADPNP